MPSHYDAAKNCRVGTMDEDQFYGEASKDNATYFRALLSAWSKAGGTLKWGAGGVGLRATVKGKETGICFVAPTFRAKGDRIELACAALRKQIGESRCTKLVESLRKVAGDRVLGTSMNSIIDPGSLPAPKRKALSKVFTDLI